MLSHSVLHFVGYRFDGATELDFPTIDPQPKTGTTNVVHPDPDPNLASAHSIIQTHQLSHHHFTPLATMSSPQRTGTPSGSGPRVTIAPPGPNGPGNGPRRPSANAPFHPPPDTGTYRDLLLFEERLKMNAHMLRRRRRRYRGELAAAG